MELLFPFSQYWWSYAVFTGLVLLLLVIDLGVFHRRAHVVSVRESLIWSAVWVTLALLFNVALYAYTAAAHDAETGSRIAFEFLTGYIVEKSLAIDNIFVFVLVFAYFGIPAQYQHRILFFGILGALVCRAVFIAIGSVLMQYHVVVLIFGVFLLVTGVRMIRTPDPKVEPDKNVLIRLFRRFMPVTPQLHGQRFLIRLDHRWHATPLLVTLLFVELSDIVFAVDSVPAIFAITREPLIVYTSNVFAILGLRAMYFLLAGAIERFHLLKYALAMILIFVGLKMVWLNDAFGGKFPIEWSLAIIGSLLGGAILVSWLLAPRHSVPHPR
jgi:tellurite resistance protein TerC